MKVCALCAIGDIHLFTLPKCATIRKKWIEFLTETDPSIKITSNIGVCANHFDKDTDFTNYKMVKLMPASSKLR